MWQECSWPEQWGGGGTTGSGRKKGETSKGSGRKPEWEVTTLLGGTTLHQSLRYPEFSFEDTDGLQEGSHDLKNLRDSKLKAYKRKLAPGGSDTWIPVGEPFVLKVGDAITQQR